MAALPLSERFRSLLFAHHGGVGDFFLAWPLFAAIAMKAGGMPLEFAGPASRLPFLEPFGAVPASGETVKALREARDGETGEDGLLRGHGLDGVLVVHPGVRPGPAYPGCVTAVCPAMLGDEPEPVHASERLLASGLGALGIEAGAGIREWARGLFQELFAKRCERTGDVLLVPGAGHPAKRWQGAAARPVQFFLLARELRRKGHTCRFVLGPDELELGMETDGWPVVQPESLTGLADTIDQASLVIGGDTGAQHLAGLLGRPVLALFGPTDERTWGPLGARVLRAPCPDGPCAVLATDIGCSRQDCLAALQPEDVARAARELLERENQGKGV